MNFFAYRLPGDTKVYAFKSQRILGRANGEGFVISPFTNREDEQMTIPADTEINVSDLDALEAESCSDSSHRLYSFPLKSVSQAEHCSIVTHAIGEMKQNPDLTKVVIATTTVHEGVLSLSDTFEALCEAYPDAFVFCFHTPQSGTWLGASPEKLLSQSGPRMTTSALAGTRPAGTSGDWDSKNIEEQRIVRDFVLDAMRSQGIRPKCGELHTKHAGPVEHLCNDISAFLLADYDILAERLLRVLSPTPALCGFPKEAAMQTILNLEPFQRGYYGGYCGPRHRNGNFEYYVNLRSLRKEGAAYCIFAGGGILPESDPDTEWLETRRKAQTLSNQLKFLPKDFYVPCPKTKSEG